MSKLTICGKEYVVPELNYAHAEIMENETGQTLFDLVLGNSSMSAARVFIQIVTGTDSATAAKLLQDHITQNGVKALGDVIRALVDAVTESDFFCALLGLPTKAEREAAQSKAEVSET